MEPRYFTEVKADRLIGPIKAAVILLVFIVGILIGMAAKARSDQLDVEFERHVEIETKKLCKFEWRMGRSTFTPDRVLVCIHGRA